ncbi:MAG TPA: NUDIX domain-containing protein, partial [Sphingomicrobium sp.]
GLQQLPGVGAYTSAAIAAIAFGEPAPAVDTNVQRVIARLHRLSRPSHAEVERLFLDLMPTQRPGDLVQAIMDLGATICRPRKPRCTECPLAELCSARASGEPERFPERRLRAARPHRHGIAYWIEREGKVWLVRRPAKGLLGGMPALPGGDWTEGFDGRPNAVGSIRHVFTHFSLDLHVVARAEPMGEGWWQPLDELAEAGLPTLYRNAVNLVLSTHDRLAA